MMKLKIGKTLILGMVAVGLLSLCSIIGLVMDNKSLTIIGVVALYTLIAMMIYAATSIISSWSKQVGDASVDLEGIMKQFEEEAAKIGKQGQRRNP